MAKDTIGNDTPAGFPHIDLMAQTLAVAQMESGGAGRHFEKAQIVGEDQIREEWVEVVGEAQIPPTNRKVEYDDRQRQRARREAGRQLC